MPFFSLFLVLFLIMNPLGNMSTFIHALDGVAKKRRRRIIAREMLIALLVIVLFNLIGEHLLGALDITQSPVYISSAIILFLTAITDIFPHLRDPEEVMTKEPFLVPLAIPGVASPALLATVMLYTYSEESQAVTLLAILFSWLVSVALLLNSHKILAKIGTQGFIAIERLIGLLLLMLSVQRFLEGLVLLYKALNQV